MVEEEAGKSELTKGTNHTLCVEEVGNKLGMGMGQDASAYMENLTTETDVMYNSSNA